MRFVALVIVLWMSLANFAAAESVTGVGAETAGQNTHVVITRSDAGPAPKIFQIGGEKPRVVIDWPSAEAKLPAIDKGRLGHVQNVRHARKIDGSLRVVLDLASGAKLLNHEVFPHQISLNVHGPVAGKTVAKHGSRYFENRLPYPRLQPLRSPVKVAAKRRKPVIVIDAGHGGKDPGAIGGKNTYEKRITLKAATELKRQLLATGRYQVILTRSDDIYIAHEERIRIARAAHGDLFISIHADATEGNTARGASVYTLADRARKRSKGIVNSQNWIMDVDLTEQSDPVGDILVDLAQRKTSSQSEMFADILLSKLSNSTRLIGNSHRRAGYFVLLAPDVPAVLLELGFLSNSHDETLLRSASHRKKVMGSVVTAINGYFATQKS